MEAWPAEVDTLTLFRGCRRYLDDNSQSTLMSEGEVGRSFVPDLCPGVTVGLNSKSVFQRGNADFVLLAHQPLLENTRPLHCCIYSHFLWFVFSAFLSSFLVFPRCHHWIKVLGKDDRTTYREQHRPCEGT